MRTSALRALVATGAAALAVSACSADPAAAPEPDDTTSSASSAGSTDSSPNAEPVDSEYVDVAAGPVGVAAGDGAVWVVSAAGEVVSRIPVGARRPDLVVNVSGVPLRVAVADGAAWVTAFEKEQLVRIDAETDWLKLAAGRSKGGCEIARRSIRGDEAKAALGTSASRALPIYEGRRSRRGTVELVPAESRGRCVSLRSEAT